MQRKNNMKNIHIIPTDSTSRLIKDVWKNTFSIVENFDTSHTDFKAQHVYITSDEEIKDGDFIFEADTNCINIADKDYRRNEFDFKIVLSTDEDLIKYGVQVIDDNFLQWLVENPGCEEVKIRQNPKVKAVVKGLGVKSFSNGYRIIKPKSELASKLKELLDGMSQEEFDEEWKKITDLKLEGPSMIEDPYQHAELINDNIEELDKAIEMHKQEQHLIEETLEEAAERATRNESLGWENEYAKEKFIEGAKWQAERSVDLDKFDDLFFAYLDYKLDLNGSGSNNISFKEWFKQRSEYKIIVPKDETEHLLSTEANKKRLLQDAEKQEQKQRLIDMMEGDEELGLYEETTKCYCGHTTYCDCGPEENLTDMLEVPMPTYKKETIEEAAEKATDIDGLDWENVYAREKFIEGAKWQREKLCDSELIQRIRASKSDAEARRIIRTF